MSKTDVFVLGENTGTEFEVKDSKYKLSAFGDVLFSLLVVCPLVVGYWRGTWSIMDLDPSLFPKYQLLFFCGSLLWGFAIIKDQMYDYLPKNPQTICKKIISQVIRKIYLYFFGFACVGHWHAIWQIVDELKPGDFRPAVGFAIVALMVLAALRGVRNNTAVPFMIVLDNEEVTFNFPTRFRTESTRQNTGLYLLDCLFSVFVVGSLVVFVWRGVWVLIDLFLFPENEVFSAIGSLVLGYATTIVVFMIQPGIRWICDRISGIWRILVADIFLLMSFIGTINVWRGIWNCLNLFYLPDERELSCWSTHIICLILLVLLNCSNSILVRGVYIDAEEPAGKCVVFPIYYLRVYFQRARSRKQQQQLQLHTMACRKQDIQDCSKHQNDINYSSKMSLDGSCKYNIESVANHIESVSVPLMLERLASDENDTNLHSEV